MLKDQEFLWLNRFQIAQEKIMESLHMLELFSSNVKLSVFGLKDFY
jgi:hypothetical protein